MLSMPAWAQYAQIQANLADVTGSFGSDAYLHFDLKNCGANVPWVSGNNLAIAKTAYDFRPDPTTGVISGKVIGTDQISCGNVNSSFYDVSVMKSNGQSIAPGPIPYQIASNTTWTPGAQPMANPPAAPGFIHIFGNPTATQQISQPAAGSGAVITVTVTSGAITDCTVVSGGTGYFSPPALSLLNATSTVPGQIYATVSNGAVSGCTVASSGLGYTNTPAVSVFGGTSLEMFGVIDLSAANVIFPPGAGGGGFSCGSPTNPGILYFNGQVCVVDTNSTLDGNGNLRVAKIGVGVTPTFKMQVETGTPGDAVAKFKNTDPTGFGVKFVPGVDANYGIAVSNQTESVNNFTVDGLGNVVSNATVTAPTLGTTGPGWIKTVQCQTPPANPPAGSITFYCDSGTGLFATRNSAGGSANPGGATWATVTSGTNANAGTYSATGNSWDFTGTTIFKLRVGSGCTTTVVGDICYDNAGSAKMWHIWQNGADNFLFTALASGTFTDQDCVKFTKTGNIINLADSGGACGGSGSASPIVFSCGQAPSGTATQFCGVGVLLTGESGTQTVMPRAGTVSNLQCRSAQALSSSQTLTLTMRKGLASIGAITSASTTLTCALNSTNTNGCSDGTHNFTVAAGDVLDIQSVPANSPAPGVVNCSIQLL